MLIKILYWLIVCVDVATMLFFFVLGLAAATSSKTSDITVAAYMLFIPGLVLTLSVLLFVCSTARVWRVLAFLLAAAPVLTFAVWEGVETVKLRFNMDSEGKLTFFPAGKLREIAAAIAANDAATVASLVPQVDINAHGYSGMTLLVLAMRQLRATPDRLEVLRVLMKAGANPNVGTDEIPLVTALQLSAKTGPEPVQLLLAGGANPNLRNSFGWPVYFSALGASKDLDELKMLLDRGADIHAVDNQKQNAVFHAATAQNWKAVLFLLQRGADWKQFRTPDGLGFKDKLESDRRVYGEQEGLAEVIEYVKRQ